MSAADVERMRIAMRELCESLKPCTEEERVRLLASLCIFFKVGDEVQKRIR